MEHSDAWAMRAAFAANPDWSLDELLKMIDEGGSPFPLTVVVGGMFMKGVAVKVDEWADHLDEKMDALLGGAASAIAREQAGLSVEDLTTTGATAGDIEKHRAEWAQQGWRALVDERRKRRAESMKRLEEAAGGEQGPLNSLPEDLAEFSVELSLPKTALTLRDATVLGLVGGPVTFPYVRVIVAHIAAWWPGGIDFGVAQEPGVS